MWTGRIHIIFHASQVCEIESNLDVDIETRREGNLIMYILLTLFFVIPYISVEKYTKNTQAIFTFITFAYKDN